MTTHQLVGRVVWTSVAAAKPAPFRTCLVILDGMVSDKLLRWAEAKGEWVYADPFDAREIRQDYTHWTYIASLNDGLKEDYP